MEKSLTHRIPHIYILSSRFRSGAFFAICFTLHRCTADCHLNKNKRVTFVSSLPCLKSNRKCIISALQDPKNHKTSCPPRSLRAIRRAALCLFGFILFADYYFLPFLASFSAFFCALYAASSALSLSTSASLAFLASASRSFASS